MPARTCASCSRQAGDYLRRGWCNACYQRWLKHGKPRSGPPPANPRGRGLTAEDRALGQARKQQLHDLRMQEFRDLDAGTPGSPYPNVYGFPPLTDREIAAKMGVSVRTVARYRAADRALGRGWTKPTDLWSGSF